MPKRPWARTLMDTEHVKASEKLLKSAKQQFCHIFLITLKGNQLHKLCFSSIWNLDTIWKHKKHIDTRWEVFSVSKSECLTEPIQMLLSPNQNTLKIRSASKVIFFWNYRLQKAELLKFPKAPCQNTYGKSKC